MRLMGREIQYNQVSLCSKFTNLMFKHPQFLLTCCCGEKGRT